MSDPAAADLSRGLCRPDQALSHSRTGQLAEAPDKGGLVELCLHIDMAQKSFAASA